ncbi:MAG: ANTAR domain-containing protein [Acidimicrobiales bacterium]
MENREAWLTKTLIELSDTLVRDFNLVDFGDLLVQRCGQLLGPAEIGLMLTSARDEMDLVAASSDRMRQMELAEIQAGDGPYRDCLGGGQALLNQHLACVESRWPRFTASARAAGFATVHVLPLRLRDDVIGVMDIFCEEGVEISHPDSDLAQALADAATVGILQERAVARGDELADQLQVALNSRLVVEQAKGMVAEGRNVDLDAAFAMLLRHARANRIPLRNVADDVVHRVLPLTEFHAVDARSVERRPKVAPR